MEDNNELSKVGLFWYERYPDPYLRRIKIKADLESELRQLELIHANGYRVIHEELPLPDNNFTLQRTIEFVNGQVWYVTYDQGGNIQNMTREFPLKDPEELISFIRQPDGT